MVAEGPRGTATGSPRGPPATAASAAIAVRPTLRDCGCASFTEGELQRKLDCSVAQSIKVHLFRPTSPSPANNSFRLRVVTDIARAITSNGGHHADCAG